MITTSIFSEYISWVQWYEYTGTFGGTLWIWILNIAIFKSVLQFREFKDRDIIKRGIFKSILLIGIPLGISFIIYYNYEEPSEKIEVVIIQPNINPYTEKYNTTDSRIGELLLKLSQEGITDSTELIIAPETVFADGTKLRNFNNSEAVYYGEQIAKINGKTDFLGGITLYDRFSDPEKSE